MLTITVYGGLDWASRITVDKIKTAALILSTHYGIEASVEVITLPVGDDEAQKYGLPEVRVEYDGEYATVCSSRIPGIDEIVDQAFRLLEKEFGQPIPLTSLGYHEAEESLFSV